MCGFEEVAAREGASLAFATKNTAKRQCAGRRRSQPEEGNTSQESRRCEGVFAKLGLLRHISCDHAGAVAGCYRPTAGGANRSQSGASWRSEGLDGPEGRETAPTLIDGPTLTVSSGKTIKCSATPATDPAVIWTRKEPEDGSHSSQSSGSEGASSPPSMERGRPLLLQSETY